MDEDLHDIDNLFKKALDEYAETPSSKVWDQLDKHLEKKQVIVITRSYKKLKWIAAALLIFSVGMAMYTYNLKLRYKEVVNKSKRNNTNSYNQDDLRNNYKTKSTDKKELQLAEGEKIKTTTDSSTLGENTIAKNKNKIADTSVVIANTNTESKASIKKDQLASNTISSLKTKKSKTNNAGNIISQNKNLAVTKSNKQQEVTANKAINKIVTGEKDDAKKEALVLNSSNYNTNFGLDTIVVEPKILPDFNLKTILSTSIINPLLVRDQGQFLTNIKSKKSAKSLNNKNFAAGIYFSADAVSTHLENDHQNFREDDKNEIRKNERNRFSTTVGIVLEKNIGNNFSVQTGASLLTRVTDIREKTLFARPDEHGNLGYRLNCSSGYTYISLKSGPPTSGDSIKSISANSTLQYLSIPIGVKYHYPLGRFSINPAVALAANFKTKGSIETLVATPNGNENTNTNNVQGLRSTFMNVSLQMNLSYDITKAFSLSLTPASRMAFTSITNNSPVKTYLNSFGLALGVNARF